MNILLIDPPGWQKHSLNLGLAYLVGSLRAADFDVQVLDMNNHNYPIEAVKKIVSAYNPRFIGVSVKTATANSAAGIIRKLKNNFTDILYVAGGPHITLCGKEFMNENKEIDFGIAGEGEYAFVNLIKNMGKEASNINGLYYRRGEELFFNHVRVDPDMAKLSFPRFEYIKDMNFNDFMYPLLTSRGCPHGCIFCCVGLISGKKWRARHPEDIVNELLQAKDNYQISSFEIMDDNFTYDIARAKKICRLIIEKEINLHWWCHNGLRADRLDRELLFLMKRAGCRSIALGIESGDENVFNGINKGEKLPDIVKTVKMIKKAGIKCVGYFIVGLPGDSVDSTKKTVRFQRSLKLADHKYNMLVPYPGTRIAQIIKEKGKMLIDIRGAYHFGDEIKASFETSGISKRTLEDCYYLVNNQGWINEEKNLIKIRNDFKSRFGKDAARIAFINEEPVKMPRNIGIEFPDARVLEVDQNFIFSDVKNEYPVHYDGNGSYFDVISKIKKEAGYRIIADKTTKKLFLEKEEVYIKGEILCDNSEWDCPGKKYFATRLHYHSRDKNSPKNGTIYKDKIALPYSPFPQFEKNACGKIESGLVFISLAAFDPESEYTAEYWGRKQDLIKTGLEPLSLERMAAEADILFCPGSLKSFALFVSEAKMNVIYNNGRRGDGSLDYTITELSSLRAGSYIIKRIKRICCNIRQAIIFIATQYSFLAKKCIKVLILWFQIIFLIVLNNIKKLISKIVRF